MKDEYEIVSHNHIRNFQLFLVNLLYRTPHIHRDFEICAILEGSVRVFSRGESVLADEGSFFLLNPCQPHELKAESPVLILSLQISPSFFAEYYPQIQRITIPFVAEHRDASASGREAFVGLLELARTYYRKDANYELKCAGIVNLLFHRLLEIFPYQSDSSVVSAARRNRDARIRAITEYIDEHYAQKLLLSDIARDQNLSLHYLSHFFRENFGLTFQQYLSRIRCEKARQLLLVTSYPLLDVSICAGFSDPKYFNRAFREQYGCAPKEYRARYVEAPTPERSAPALTAQEFFSDEESLALVEEFLRREEDGRGGKAD